MGAFSIRPISGEDRQWIADLMVDHWGAEIVVSRGVVYTGADLPGFIAEMDGERVGLLTLNIAGEDCEIVTLDSLKEGIGIGAALIDAARQTALDAGCRRLWFITTNDNLHMIGFGQKRGFELAAVHRGAIAVSRKIKPQIPAIGIDGIPIRDEIELEMIL
ncbi:MAG: GNAT family N-acetyltransferase [Anaerolineae bacterium]|nr:GNAT family N-acetyltransferase [Anaerolineae bacterium]